MEGRWRGGEEEYRKHECKVVNQWVQLRNESVKVGLAVFRAAELLCASAGANRLLVHHRGALIDRRH